MDLWLDNSKDLTSFENPLLIFSCPIGCFWVQVSLQCSWDYLLDEWKLTIKCFQSTVDKTRLVCWSVKFNIWEAEWCNGLSKCLIFVSQRCQSRFLYCWIRSCWIVWFILGMSMSSKTRTSLAWSHRETFFNVCTTVKCKILFIRAWLNVRSCYLGWLCKSSFKLAVE